MAEQCYKVRERSNGKYRYAFSIIRIFDNDKHIVKQYCKELGLGIQKCLFIIYNVFQENTVRLFDKGEMNTFSDPINFTNLVACHLTEFLSSSLEMTDSETRRGCVGSTVMNNSGTDNATEPDLVDESRWDDRLRLLEQECDVLFDHLGSLLDQVHCASPQCPFVEASQYRVTTVALYRSLVALQCLCVFTSTDNKHKMCHMCQTVSAKLTRSGGSLNALLALVLQQRQ